MELKPGERGTNRKIHKGSIVTLVLGIVPYALLFLLFKLSLDCITRTKGVPLSQLPFYCSPSYLMDSLSQISILSAISALILGIIVYIKMQKFPEIYKGLYVNIAGVILALIYLGFISLLT